MKLVEKKYLLPFIAITTLFALWGFANDITNPMVAAFRLLWRLCHYGGTRGLVHPALQL